MARKHVDLPGSQRPAKADAKRLRDADPNARVEVTLELRHPALPGANDLPANPLSRSELAAKYGASAADAEQVSEVLKGYGLKVEEVSLATWSMRVSGPVSAMEAAFNAKLGIYHSREQGEFRGREGKLQIPIELAGIVTGVFGLDERRVARRKGSAAATSTPAPLGPSDIEAHYQFPAGDGSGQTVGIAEFGGGYFASDLKAYCQKFNLTAPTVTVHSVNLKSLTLQQIQQLPQQEMQEELDEAGEVNMDVQIVAGLCPKATIVVYFATFDQKGWVDLLNQVLAGKPSKVDTLSVSWGLAEDSPDWSANAVTAINSRLNALAAIGLTVCVSAGDDGSGDAVGDNRAHVDFPGSSPFVLCVGGTMLSASGAETTWWVSPGQRNNRGGGATGGGVSVKFARPSWQNVHIASVNPGSIDGRVIPDVSALAGSPFYDLIFMGQDSPNGGTSASAPLWASLLARVKAQRFVTPLLYENGRNGQPLGASVCTDITTGQNTSSPTPGVGYQAGPGYDAVTGWGTPKGQALLAAFEDAGS